MAADTKPKTLYQGVERDGFGMKMLTTMGWREGCGLGKNKDGIVKHLHAKKRMVGTGVGADVKNDASGKNSTNWTMNTVAFDDVLRSLNRTHSAEELAKTREEESASDSASKKEKKRKLTKEEKKAAKKEAKKAKKNEVGRSVVSHAGRYQKRESQKMVSNYSATDLDAILGGGFVALPEVRATNAETSASESDSEDDKDTKAVAVPTEPAKPKKKVIEIERPKWVFDPPSEDWWGWRVGFRPEGHGGGGNSDDMDALERKRGFDEDDQTKLFEDTHAGANKNRQGLGAGVGRAVDADFAGTKKAFGAEDEVTEEETAAAEAAKKVKWQKLCEKILSKSDGSMKTKKFISKILDKCACGPAENIRALYQDAMFHFLSRSGAFTSLEEDVVKLVKEN